MKEVAKETARPRGGAGYPGLAEAAFAGAALLLLLPAFFFSLGPLIHTRGRAWEYEPVRELLIVSLVLFVLTVIAPLVAAYRLSRRPKR